ncbi:MAG: pyroglutamyl-peptidase I [Hyphomicrobiaceae bacterium]
MMAVANGRTTVLLTGFGPFPSVPANATSVLVPRLAEAARAAFPGIVFETRTLPTEWAAGIDHLHSLYQGMAPSVALHFGVSSRARGFEVEARGRNRLAFLPDATGAFPSAPMLRAGGHEYLASTIPVVSIVERLRRRGLPAFVSRDAGTYLCNATLYTALDMARRTERDHRIGFIHVPSSLPIEERRPASGVPPRCPLTWRDAIDGGLEIIGAVLGRQAARR